MPFYESAPVGTGPTLILGASANIDSTISPILIGRQNGVAWSFNMGMWTNGQRQLSSDNDVRVPAAMTMVAQKIHAMWELCAPPVPRSENCSGDPGKPIGSRFFFGRREVSSVHEWHDG